MSESSEDQKRRDETVGDFLLRLLVVSVFLAVFLKILGPLFGEVMAWGASNLLASVSSPYYLESLEWVGSGFIVKSWMSPVLYGFELHTLMLLFGLPLAFALALPAPRNRGYWVRLLATLIGSYLMCVLVIALVSDRTLISNFASYGLRVQPTWREAFSETVITQLWAVTTIGFPLFIIVALAPASGQLSPEMSKYFGAPNRGDPLGVLAILTVILVLCYAVSPVVRSGRDAVRAEPPRRYFDHLADLNPENLGSSLMVMADAIAEHGNILAAIETVHAARRHLDGSALKEATLALKELRARRRRIELRQSAREQIEERKASNDGRRRKGWRLKLPEGWRFVPFFE